MWLIVDEKHRVIYMSDSLADAYKELNSYSPFIIDSCGLDIINAEDL